MALMKMGLAIFAEPRISGTLPVNSTHRGLLFDLTPHIIRDASVEFETDAHGFSFLRVSAKLRHVDAVRVYDMSPSQHLVLNDGIGTIFEGRIEDRKLLPDGVELTAFGYWNALRDRLITGLWSTVDLGRWFWLNATDRAELQGTDRWLTRKDTEIVFGARKNEAFTPSVDGINSTYAACGWLLPEGSIRWIERIDFDYEINAPNSTTLTLYVSSAGIGGSSSLEWFEAGAGIGSINSGSVTETFHVSLERNAIWFRIQQGSDYTFTTETGEVYAKIFNIRIKGKNQATITARDVIVDVLDDTNTSTSEAGFTPLSPCSDEIISPGIDLDEALYVDIDRSTLITTLAGQGDLNTPPQLYETGVTDDRRLYFRPAGTMSSTWYIDIEALDVSSSMSTLINQVYVIFRDVRGQRVITSVVSDEPSVVTYDVRREAVLSNLSQNTTIADTQRDVFLANHKNMSVQATFQIANIENGFGGSVMPWHVRAGDVVILRNITQMGFGDVLNFSRFTIRRARYNAVTDVLELEPSFSSPIIPYLVAENSLQANPEGKWQFTV